MSSWPSCPLGEVCDINPRQNGAERLAPSSEVTFVPMAAVDEHRGMIVGAESRLLGDIQGNYTPFQDGDVLFAKITPCMENGKAAIAQGLSNGCGFGSTEFHVIRCRTRVLPEWVFAFVRQPWFRETARRNFTGTAGQQRVPGDFIRNVPIPLPPIREQERLVRILGEAEALRHLRGDANNRIRDLVFALFEKMFGDPAGNPKRWAIWKLRDLSLKFSDGPFGSNLKSEHYTEQGIRVIRLQNIGIGTLIDEGKVFVSPGHFDRLAKHACAPGDVLVGTLGDPNLRACILPQHIPCALNKADCVQIRPDPEKATSEYLCWLLNLPATLSMAAGMIAGQTRSRISMGRLAELSVPLPPIGVQRAFATCVTEIRELQASQAVSRQRLDDLFQCLLYQAFQGTL